MLRDIRPDIRRYEDIVKQLKGKIRERWVLLEEKKTMSALQVFQHRELAQKIAATTEDIEELKNEKALLLHQFGYLDAKGMETVRQKVSSMEVSLQKLDRQEAKYMDELDTALTQFDELCRQAADMDTAELDAARQAIRPEKEQATVQSLKSTHGKRFNSQMLAQSREDVAETLGEAAELVSIREKLQQLHKQPEQQHRRKEHGQER